VFNTISCLKIAIKARENTNVIKLIWKTRICCTSHTNTRKAEHLQLQSARDNFEHIKRGWKRGQFWGRGHVGAGPKTKPKLKTFELNSRSNVYVDEGLCHCVPQHQQKQQQEEEGEGKPQIYSELVGGEGAGIVQNCKTHCSTWKF